MTTFTQRLSVALETRRDRALFQPQSRREVVVRGDGHRAASMVGWRA